MNSKQHIYFYSKTNSFFEFSNFYIRKFELDGLIWYSVEQYYQANKSADLKGYNMIHSCSNPVDALKLGRAVNMRPDWEKVKEQYMYKALKAKFTQHEDLRRILLATGDAELHEKSTHPYWGYKGKDRLGKLLMQVRDEIYEEFM